MQGGNALPWVIAIAIGSVVLQHISYSNEYAEMAEDVRRLEQEALILRSNYEAFREGVIYGKP